MTFPKTHLEGRLGEYQNKVNKPRVCGMECFLSLLSFLCCMYAVMAYFHPALPYQKEQKDACHLLRCFCVMFIAKSHKFVKSAS